MYSTKPEVYPEDCWDQQEEMRVSKALWVSKWGRGGEMCLLSVMVLVDNSVRQVQVVNLAGVVVLRWLTVHDHWGEEMMRNLLVCGRSGVVSAHRYGVAQKKAHEVFGGHC